MESPAVTHECNGACPSCCLQSPAQIIAEGDAKAKSKALTLSGALLTLLIAAHVYTFLHKGVSLPIPDVVWAFVLGPWLGHGVSKLIELIESTKGGTK